jgi:conjugative transfer signal peptidase TraF
MAAMAEVPHRPLLRLDKSSALLRRFAAQGASPRGVAAAAAAVSLALAGTIFWPPLPLLVWNASASSPLGYYTVAPWAHPRTGDLVIAWPPPAARRLAASRHYLPASVPLVKRVAAAAGDRVCAKGRTIFIDGRPAALRRASDPSGRPMPRWSGCRMLQRGELFLLTPNAPGAFDGRYFGVTRARQVVGRARLLWARPAIGSHGG